MTRELKVAQSIAVEVQETLFPASKIIAIAGSIRRKKMFCGDIEIVAIPSNINSFALKLYENYKEGMKRETRYKKFFHKSMQVDLFIPPEHDFFRQFAIRTGCADYSHKTIARAWVKKGWVGTHDGLRLGDECVAHQTNPGGSASAAPKQVWKLKPTITTPTLPPIWKSEEEFFEWIGVKWIAPELRN